MRIMVNPDTKLRRKLIAFIADNRGPCKEDVFRFMKGDRSKNSTIKLIEQLIEQGIIVARKQNSKRFQLFINYSNRSALLICEIQDFASTYYVLLDKVISKLRATEQEVKFNGSDYRINEIEKDLVHALVYICRYFTDICVFNKIFNIHAEIKDIAALERIHSIISQVRGEILARLFDTVSVASSLTLYENKKDLTDSILLKPFAIDIESLYRLKRVFDSNDMTTEFEPVMDILWSAGSEIIEFRRTLGFEFQNASFNLLDFKDWRKVLMLFAEIYEDPSVVHTRYQYSNTTF